MIVYLFELIVYINIVVKLWARLVGLYQNLGTAMVLFASSDLFLVATVLIALYVIALYQMNQ